MITKVPIQIGSLGFLRRHEVYISYDGPSVFSAISPMGHLFFCCIVERYLPEDDMEDDRSFDLYIVTEVTPERLRMIKRGAIGVIDAFRVPESGNVYLVKIWHRPTEVDVIPVEQDYVDYALGTGPGRFLNFEDSRFPTLDYLEISDLAVREHRTFSVLELKGISNEAAETSIEDAGEFFLAAQKIVTYAAMFTNGRTSNAGRIPSDIQRDSELTLAGIRAASLAFIVAEAYRRGTQLSIAPNSILSDALTKVGDLIDAGSAGADSLKSQLQQLNKRLINGFIIMLESTETVATGLTLSRFDFDGASRHSSISGQRITESINTAKSILGVSRELIEIDGTLVGYNSRSMRFEINGNDKSFHGMARKEARGELPALTIGGRYKFSLELESFANDRGVQEQKYYLIGAESLTENI